MNIVFIIEPWWKTWNILSKKNLGTSLIWVSTSEPIRRTNGKRFDGSRSNGLRDSIAIRVTPRPFLSHFLRETYWPFIEKWTSLVLRKRLYIIFLYRLKQMKFRKLDLHDSNKMIISLIRISKNIFFFFSFFFPSFFYFLFFFYETHRSRLFVVNSFVIYFIILW